MCKYVHLSPLQVNEKQPTTPASNVIAYILTIQILLSDFTSHYYQLHNKNNLAKLSLCNNRMVRQRLSPET